MKKLKALNLGKNLSRNEMKDVFGGIADLPRTESYCTCGTWPPVLVDGKICSCSMYCSCRCTNIYGGNGGCN